MFATSGREKVEAFVVFLHADLRSDGVIFGRWAAIGRGRGSAGMQDGVVMVQGAGAAAAAVSVKDGCSAGFDFSS